MSNELTEQVCEAIEMYAGADICWKGWETYVVQYNTPDEAAERIIALVRADERKRIRAALLACSDDGVEVTEAGGLNYLLTLRELLECELHRIGLTEEGTDHA